MLISLDLLFIIMCVSGGLSALLYAIASYMTGCQGYAFAAAWAALCCLTALNGLLA